MTRQKKNSQFFEMSEESDMSIVLVSDVSEVTRDGGESSFFSPRLAPNVTSSRR